MPQPVKPQVQGTDVKSLGEQTGVKQWKQGDPVNVIGDLKEDPAETPVPPAGTDAQQPQGPAVYKPRVLKSSEPQVLGDDLRGLAKVQPYQPGAPVRVIEDLKESGTEQ